MHERKYWTTTTTVATLIVILGVSYLFLANQFGGRVDSKKALSIEVGMKMDEVLQILGPPHVKLDTQNTVSWNYRVQGAGDLLHVEFDQNSKVKWVSF